MVIHSFFNILWLSLGSQGTAIVDKISALCERGFKHVRSSMRVLSSNRSAWASSSRPNSIHEVPHSKNMDKAGVARERIDEQHTSLSSFTANEKPIETSARTNIADSSSQSSTTNPQATRAAMPHLLQGAVGNGHPSVSANPEVTLHVVSVEHKLTAEEKEELQRAHSMSIQERNRRRAKQAGEVQAAPARVSAELAQQPWFRSSCSTDPATIRRELEDQPLGTFIVCPRDLPDTYTLHVCEIGRVRRIELDPELSPDDAIIFRFPGKANAFSSIIELVDYFATHAYGNDNTGCPLFFALRDQTTVS